MVKESVATATGEIVVLPRVEEASISVGFDRQQVYEGEDVAVSGILSRSRDGSPLSGRDVQVVVFVAGDPDQAPVASMTPKTGMDGRFSFLFTMLQGGYQAKASFSGEGFRDASAVSSSVLGVFPRTMPGVPKESYYDRWLDMLSRTTPVGRCPVDGKIYIKPNMGERIEGFPCPVHKVFLALPFTPPPPPPGWDSQGAS